MLNTRERIVQYSDEDLQAIRGRLRTQQRGMEWRAHTNIEVFKQRGEDRGETHPLYEEFYFRYRQAVLRWGALDGLATKMDLEIGRRRLITGVHK